jgi:hypothetical protein
MVPHLSSTSFVSAASEKIGSDNHDGLQTAIPIDDLEEEVVDEESKAKIRQEARLRVELQLKETTVHAQVETDDDKKRAHRERNRGRCGRVRDYI